MNDVARKLSETVRPYLGALLLGWILAASFSLQADHISHKKKYRPSSADTLYLQELLAQCEKGNGQTCDRYGRMVAELGRPGDRTRGLTYVRRACQLAYMPACVKTSPRQPARFLYPGQRCGPKTNKLISFKSVNVAGKGPRLTVMRLKAKSSLARAGLKRGDQLLTLNGQPATDIDKVLASIDRGQVLLEVERPGAPVPYSVYCP